VEGKSAPPATTAAELARKSLRLICGEDLLTSAPRMYLDHQDF
jgi:hypothetical protein